MKAIKLIAASICLFPAISYADFCDILKGGHTGAAQQCRTQGAKGGAEFIGNWSILSTKATQRSTGKAGKYTVGSTPPYKYNLKPAISGDYKLGVYYLNAVCSFNNRQITISEAGLAYGLRGTEPVYVEYSVDGKAPILERWPVSQDYDLVIPESSKLPGLLKTSSTLSVYAIISNNLGWKVKKGELHYKLDGYNKVQGTVCR